eukprot:5436307-Prymnesium_polylepis.1
MDMYNCESQWTATVVVTVSGSRVLVGHVVGKAMATTTAATVATAATAAAAATAALQQSYSRTTAATAELQ